LNVCEDAAENTANILSKSKKNSKKINKNLNDLKLVFLELAHLGLYSGKVWENRFFLYCMTLVDPYSKLLLKLQHQAEFLDHGPKIWG